MASSISPSKIWEKEREREDVKDEKEAEKNSPTTEKLELKQELLQVISYWLRGLSRGSRFRTGRQHRRCAPECVCSGCGGVHGGGSSDSSDVLAWWRAVLSGVSVLPQHPCSR